MPISLNEARSKALGKIGSSKDEFQTFVASNVLEQYGIAFKKELETLMSQRQIVGSGALMDSINPIVDSDGKRLTITMLDYYDFVNEGVKGKGPNAKNGLNSSYFFKNYGMNKEGRDSIKKYILSGKAKVSSTSRDKARGIGLERKGVQGSKKKSLIDNQVDTLIYQIKKYGIKQTDYFTDAFEKVFANWEKDMAEAYGEDVALSLSLKSSKK